MPFENERALILIKGLCWFKKIHLIFYPNFRWKSDLYKADGIKPMAHKRFYASSVLNKDGNLWVLGGTAQDKASDTSEVYEYKPRGEGTWTLIEDESANIRFKSSQQIEKHK